MSFPFFDADADETAQRVTGATGILHSIVAHNQDATDTVYLQIFSTSPTVGTTVPRSSFPLAPGVSGYFFDELYIGTAGIWYAVTTTPTGNTAPPSTVTLNVEFS